MGLTEILEHARSSVRSGALRSMPSVRAYGAAFEQASEQARSGAPNIFTFHARVPESHRKISYVDVVHDHHDFDYDGILAHFVRSARNYNPRAVIWLVTSLEDRLSVPEDANLRIVRLPIDTAAPMLERVRAMAAYVGSSAFSADTAFLDTDAFVNAPLAPLFQSAFDIGVTIRPTEGFYMPLNEGVIFARHERRAAVESFFSGYIGTYDRLMTDPTIEAYYGDIARWRGGQLSLNAVASSFAAERPDVRIENFDCDHYNYWARPEVRFEPDAWDKKVVLHLKGDSKHHLDGFFDYHAARLKGAVAVEA